MKAKKHFACKFAKTEFLIFHSHDRKDSDNHWYHLPSVGFCPLFLSRNIPLDRASPGRHSRRRFFRIVSFSTGHLSFGKCVVFSYSLADPAMNAATIFWVFLGSGTGGVARLVLGWLFRQHWPSAFPWGTLTINVLACALAGLVVSRNDAFSIQQVPLSTILLVGFCGGFSTFSTFGLETWQLMTRGNTVGALAYVLFSVVAGLLAFALCMKGQ
jgi:CrcB protein